MRSTMILWLGWAMVVGLGCGAGHLGDGADDDAGLTPDCGTEICDDNEFCSFAGMCIPIGTCAHDGDCAAGQHCGEESQVCLDDGACVDNGDCDDGMVCNADRECVIGGECGQDEIDTSRPAPNMLILLDRSGSMDGDAGGNSRWNVAKAAIGTVTGNFADQIRFGLATYSACLSGGCSAGSIVVPIADDGASAVSAFLADKLDQGSSNGSQNTGSGIAYLCDSGDPETSTGKSLNALVGQSSLQDDQRDNFVLLITDGEESGSCIEGGINGPAGAAALLAQTISVPTYVVGLGINSAALNQIAVAGGTDALLPANNEAELTAALAEVASDVVSCDLVLASDPPNPDEIHVFFNDQQPEIPVDAVDGWTYDPATHTITFHGASCDALRGGTVTDIDVTYGCAEPVVG